MSARYGFSRILTPPLCYLLCYLLLFTPDALAWNASGHRLMALIAYEHLTPEAKQYVNQLTNEDDRHYPPLSRFLYASVWPDRNVVNGKRRWDTWHFIDQPIGPLRRLALPLESDNIVMALYRVERMTFNKALDPHRRAWALRYLIHLIGDIHQPLHVVSRFSSDHPHGDQGGNDYLIETDEADSLHQLWDRGLGLFKRRGHMRLAHRLEQRYPIQHYSTDALTFNPKRWAHESLMIALGSVYNVPEFGVPSAAYREWAREIIGQQIVLAGYRLAYLLNMCVSSCLPKLGLLHAEFRRAVTRQK